MVIGSIGTNIVENITFRDIYLRDTYKGIYLKFLANKSKNRKKNINGSFDPWGLIRDITYENIIMDSPKSWPIWMGPAQQADNPNPCLSNPCSICWPTGLVEFKG